MDGFTQAIKGVQNLVESDVNKMSPDGVFREEGPVSDQIGILDLPESDEKLLKLAKDWEAKYASYEPEIQKIWKRNLYSYLGRNSQGELLDSNLPSAANLQFVAEETFLPAALARNPDPLVWCDNSPEGNAIADAVKTMLQFHADQLLLKRKLSVMVRQWSIYHLGVLKPGWDKKSNDVAIENRKIKDFIFDPDGYVDVYGHFTSWLGERCTVKAQELIEEYPEHEQYIKESVTTDAVVNLGTEITYTEFWTDEFCFTRYKEKILDKHKNEFFNYDEEEKDIEGKPLLGQDQQPIMKKASNHFAMPLKPYIFLSIFSMQERPHDITGLIEQNIGNQNKVTKRTEQIDENVSQMNNGIAFSEDNFNQETAKQASNALTRGVGKVLIPSGGPAQNAIIRIPAPNMPESAFKDLENSENHLRDSWGVQGIVSQQQKPDTTARGMMLNQGRDTSRIGGGISDVVEQSVARACYNWLVQLYKVFYDEQHFAAVMGIGKAVQYAQLSQANLDRQLIVGVAPNSMKPKDELSTMNQAIELFQQGAIGPKTLLEAINFPNSDESSADGVLWQVDKGAYIQLNYPELAQQLQQLQAQAQQAQMQAQAQQQQQQAQQFQQQQGQQQQAHQQKLQQGAEMHQAKVAQFKDMASAKLAQATSQPSTKK